MVAAALVARIASEASELVAEADDHKVHFLAASRDELVAKLGRSDLHRDCPGELEVFDRK